MFGQHGSYNESVKATLEAINQMQAAGIIGKYAIGGAVGATFFLEPAATLDVDIFVALPTAADGLLMSRAPIYDYLRTHAARCRMSTFLLEAGRYSSFRRRMIWNAMQFLEQGAVDKAKLQNLLERHGLTAKWQQFERKYLEGSHE